MTPRALCRIPFLALVPLLVAAAPAHAQDTTDVQDLPPAGYGTLRQEDIAVHLQTATLQIKVLPLDERVIRLLSPDSYRALHGLVQLKAAAIADVDAQNGIGRPSLFVVTFFGLQERVPFSPEALTISSRQRFFRPVAILPLNPRWGEHQLAQRETLTAVYVFEEGIAVLEPFSVSYEGVQNSDWAQTLRTLDTERAAVIGRAAADSTRP